MSLKKKCGHFLKGHRIPILPLISNPKQCLMYITECSVTKNCSREEIEPFTRQERCNVYLIDSVNVVYLKNI